MNDVRKGIISHEAVVKVNGVGGSWTYTVPFGNSTRKRRIKKIVVSARLMTTASFLIKSFKAEANCKDFIINSNPDLVLADDGATIINSQSISDVVVDNALINNISDFNGAAVIELDQPWTSSDLTIVVYLTLNSSTTTKTHHLVLNIFYEELD